MSATERCGARVLPANGEHVSPCELEKGHVGEHQGRCLGSRAVWSGGAIEPGPAVRAEPPPVRTDSTAVWPLVIADIMEQDRLDETPARVVERLAADMQARDAEGRRKYGTPLQVENGRNPAVDAYQEALDLTVYARQRWERHHTRAWWLIYVDALKLAARICAELTEEGR